MKMIRYFFLVEVTDFVMTKVPSKVYCAWTEFTPTINILSQDEGKFNDIF